MKEFELKYGCNPNQKPSTLYKLLLHQRMQDQLPPTKTCDYTPRNCAYPHLFLRLPFAYSPYEHALMKQSQPVVQLFAFVCHLKCR